MSPTKFSQLIPDHGPYICFTQSPQRRQRRNESFCLHDSYNIFPIDSRSRSIHLFHAKPATEAKAQRKPLPQWFLQHFPNCFQIAVHSFVSRKARNGGKGATQTFASMIPPTFYQLLPGRGPYICFTQCSQRRQRRNESFPSMSPTKPYSQIPFRPCVLISLRLCVKPVYCRTPSRCAIPFADAA
jgi:hypothetical protein